MKLPLHHRRGQFRIPIGSAGRRVATRKNLALALALGFLITGAGHFYIGRVGRGLAFLLGAAIGWSRLGVLGLAVSAWSLFDVYNLAKKQNASLALSE